MPNYNFPSNRYNSIGYKKQKRADKFWGYVLAVALLAFLGALVYFHYEVVMPYLSAITETAYAGEPCDNPDRYINREEAKEWCYGI